MARIRNRDRNRTEEEKKRAADEARARGESPPHEDDAGAVLDEIDREEADGQEIEDERQPGNPPPLNAPDERAFTPGGDGGPGDLSDEDEQKKMIRYHAEEKPWMREQMQKDQERDARQFEENAMRQDAAEIERQRAGQAPDPDDAGAVLDEPAPGDNRSPDNARQQDQSRSPVHEDDAGAVLDEPAPSSDRERDKGMDID